MKVAFFFYRRTTSSAIPSLRLRIVTLLSETIQIYLLLPLFSPSLPLKVREEPFAFCSFG